ncbi:hypothetical protein F2P79_010869 [Pimephales promelas]|nr:hypothetical protein F2P79_010869 [Pimephales promelas]
MRDFYMDDGVSSVECAEKAIQSAREARQVIQAVARLLRRVRKDKSSDHSTVAEREDAKSIIMKDLQSQAYAEEIALLRKGKQLSRNNRGIHIEMLDDMSTDAFINGLRCFIVIRGAVRLIRCDQGSNFIGAKNEFAKAMTEIDTNRLHLVGKEYKLLWCCEGVVKAM